MNKSVRLLLWFIVLMFIQTFVLDPLLLGIAFTPFIYVLILMLLPNNWASWIVLLMGFFTGICVDFLFFSGGVHTAACLIACFTRNLFIRFSFRDTLSPEELKIKHESFGQLMRYVTVMVLVHHFFMLAFIVANSNKIEWFLYAWAINSLITILFIGATLILTRKVLP